MTLTIPKSSVMVRKENENDANYLIRWYSRWSACKRGILQAENSSEQIYWFDCLEETNRFINILEIKIGYERLTTQILKNKNV